MSVPVMVHRPAPSRVYPEYAKTTFLVYGLILSIAIFFVVAFIAYLGRYVASRDAAPLPGIPPLIWVSTAILLAGSQLLWSSYRAVRRERQSRFRWRLTLAFLLGGVFCVLQTLGMLELLEWHQRQAVHEAGTIAATMLMVFLHILHFAVGYIALAFVTVQAYRDRYDHEYYNGVRLAAVYWRFLDVIWLLMLAMFWWTSAARSF